MAFEVARVHQLICSRVEDESVLNASSNTCDSGAIGYMSPQSCSPQNAYLHKRDPVYFPCESHGNDQSVEVSTSLVDTSSVSAETESDDDGELLQCLAQQIAHSMLDEESKADTCAEDVRRSGCSGAPDISNVELSGGRPSPSNWCNSRWSSGHLLPSSQSSSSVSSQVSSPSSAPSFGNEDAWDTLYAAAGEVLKLNVHEKKISALSNDGPPPSIVCHKALRGQTQQSRTSGHHGRNSPSHSARKLEECITFNKQSQKNWASQCVAMHTMANQGGSQFPQHQRHHQLFSANGQRTLNNFSPGSQVDCKNMWRNRQTDLNAGSGVRVVFLGAASGRDSGTGVFLPRSFVNAPEHKKRGGVLTRAKSPEEGVWPTLQQSMHRTILRQPVAHEPCLPTEWTY
ncbi:uncharacterized protein [Physcomitrium patens]|uniref:Uncharacterized protein n=2 Tax=Physcomitrium patens TaxID=3218 RepID=A0A2K1KER1_PHYPA|nr:uncharacterized protein LOC112284031 isoform X1 [Physcomitrium patens]XP_024379276.1 uncharacterized protein LOC112284031 isoform X1 [Physcomitrium patens]XP_024379277.1 uncharacterized protein LOC112284031 isoform X1 [Physcomitrium patens]PNR52267.1 hypothetical protein PHYPA_008641 [Physcomitrium patens]|eukprot:XP_024379275.1 uncharacterized protein LOC112284031 isoform X1 [Physcomitrella patens]